MSILDNTVRIMFAFTIGELNNTYNYFQTILTHSRSRVALEILKMANEQKKRLKVYITESSPDKSG